MSDDLWPKHPPAAPPVWSAPPAWVPPPAAPIGASGLADAAPLVEEITLGRAPSDQGTGGGRGVGRLVGLGVGIVAVVALAAAAASAVLGDGTGADSPDEAVLSLAEAVSNEDVVAMFTALSPPEVGSAAELYPRVVALAQREGALQGDNPLAGVDVTITDLRVEVEQLHPDVAKVRLVDGTIRLVVDPALVDPALRDDTEAIDESFAFADLDERAAATIDEFAGADEYGFDPVPFDLTAPSGAFLMATRHEGRWYVSLFYTAAEYAREVLDLPPADFNASRSDPPPGAASPDAVVTNVAAYLSEVDVDSLAANGVTPDVLTDAAAMDAFVNPEELGVVLDYRRSFEAFSEQLLGAAGLDPDGAVELFAGLDVTGDMEVSMTTSVDDLGGGLARVNLEGGTMSGWLEMTDELSGDVFRAEASAEFTGVCLTGEGRTTGPSEWDNDETTFTACGTDEREWPEELDRLFIVVSEHDGTWYLSYVETVLAYAEIVVDDQLAS